MATSGRVHLAGTIVVAMAIALVIPQGVVQAQSGRIESDAARSVSPVLPPRPPSAKAAAGGAATTKAQPAPPSVANVVRASDVQDPNQVGLSGVVLGMRIDSTLSYLGVTRCAPRIKQVMVALTDSRPAAYFFEPTGRNANQSPLLITLESLSGENQADGSRYSILTVNPDCSGFYTQTVSWPAPCAEVARTSFPNFRFDRRIVANVDAFRSSPMLQMSAMKTPGGCVTVKKEIFR
jgi:hypothetical protein